MPGHARELAVRSLAWLVSAVVAGVVRDVVAAYPPAWALGDVMDHAGCASVQTGGEAERLAAALAMARCDRVLVVLAGYQPEGPLVAEIDAFEGSAPPRPPALLHRAPSGAIQRLFPDRAPVVGVIVDRTRSRPAGTTFRALAREARGGRRLRARMVPVMDAGL